MEYSKTTDAVYCFDCRHFGKEGQDLFRKTGFRAWNKAYGDDKNNILLRHDVSENHATAAHRKKAFTAMKNTNSTHAFSVATLISDEHKRQVFENRHYLSTICEILRLTACQNIAHRAHDESESSQNRGNFIEILSLVADHDEIIKKKLLSLGKM